MGESTYVNVENVPVRGATMPESVLCSENECTHSTHTIVKVTTGRHLLS